MPPPTPIDTHQGNLDYEGGAVGLGALRSSLRLVDTYLDLLQTDGRR